jgi:hypothetical protein
MRSNGLVGMIEIAGKNEFWILTSAGFAPFGVTDSKEDADMMVNMTKRSNDPDSIHVVRAIELRKSQTEANFWRQKLFEHMKGFDTFPDMITTQLLERYAKEIEQKVAEVK